MNLAEISYRMSTDLDFVNRLKQNPEQTLKQEGLPIDPEELQSLNVFLLNNTFPRLDAAGTILDIPIDPWYTG